MAMPKKGPPQHLTDFLLNLKEVAGLLAIHKTISGSGRGRRYDVEVLNKSAIVLIVACWEAYVEDVAAAALMHLISNASDHKVFPSYVLEVVASKHQGPNAWLLAGDGWKKALSDNLKEVLAKTTGKLNTPRAEDVDSIFYKTIGLQNLSSHWKWHSRNSSQVISALNELITLRGGIAHRVKHSKSVYKRDVERAADLVSRLAAKTNNSVGAYLHQRTGRSGWGTAVYKGMS